MSIVHLTEASSGAPTLSGTNGALAAIMDWALVQNGWAIEYTSGNARVYRPGSGNRFRLHMNDDSGTSGDARLCIARGCENASAATTLVDPFPTVALQGNTLSNWLKSSTADGTARNYDIYVATTFVLFFSNYAGATNVWEFHFFGDVGAARPGDSYNTMIVVRNSAGFATTNFASVVQSITGNAHNWFARSYDGTVKSSMGAPIGYSGTWGNISSMSLALAGTTAGIDREKSSIVDTGANVTTIAAATGLAVRGYFPNVWLPLHLGRGTVNTRDTFTDTSYNAGATFRVFTGSNATNSGGWLIVEESDTWSPPSG